MIDVDEKQRLIARGEQAARLLDFEVFEEVKARYHREWELEVDPQKREVIWFQLKALEALKSSLRVIIGEGEHARGVLQKRQ